MTGSTVDEAQAMKSFIYDRLQLSEVRACVAKRHPEWQDLDTPVRQYRDFLWVCWYTNHTVPGKRVPGVGERADEVWHCHMLRPKKYNNDCEDVFGKGMILDHGPIDNYDHDAVLTEAAACYAAAENTPFPPDFVDTECQYGITVVR
jgi:hypothetical protein